MPEAFGSRLLTRIQKYGPLCIGLDPSRAVLARWGQADDVSGLGRFVEDFLALVPDHVAAIKPQIAFFERFGSGGLRILEDAVAQLRQRGHLVVLDAKRSDIGSSVEGYADAYFGPGPLRVDAITASPYLGIGALEPLLEAALAQQAGVFILCRTSNPEGRSLQAASLAGRPLWRAVQEEVAGWNRGADCGSIGLVIGATVEGDVVGVGDHNGPILAPGFGWQGSGPGDFTTLFTSTCDRTLASFSRSLLVPGPEGFEAAVEAAQADFGAEPGGETRALNPIEAR